MAISPSIRITRMISTPVTAYVRNAAGPASCITAPDPTKRPAPMTPPIAIIVRWRCLSPFWRVGAGESVVWVMGFSYPSADRATR